jgi:spermidine/putrescine transport system permease protein
MKAHPRVTLSALSMALPGYLLLLLPLTVLVWRSFLVKDFATGQVEWSLAWYQKLLGNPELGAALVSSFWIACVSSLISTLLGTIAALGLAKSQHFFGKGIIESLIRVPLALPEIVMGLSLLIWFVFLSLTLGTFSVILAHVTFSVSYVVLTVRARMEGFDRSLEDAARDLGATRFQVFLRITMPLILPAVISGALMAFTLSFDDFLITYFVSGVGTDTLPLRVYSMIRFGVSPELNALSTVLLVLTTAIAGYGLRKTIKSP